MLPPVLFVLILYGPCVMVCSYTDSTSCISLCVSVPLIIVSEGCISFLVLQSVRVELFIPYSGFSYFKVAVLVILQTVGYVASCLHVVAT